MAPSRPALAVAFTAVTTVIVVWMSSSDFTSLRRMSRFHSETVLLANTTAQETSSSGGQTTQSTRRATHVTKTIPATWNTWPKQDILLGEPSPDESNIFFMETSCMEVGKQPPLVPENETGLHLSPRAACIIESAATTNPGRTVYLLHTCPVNMTALLRSAASPQTTALRMPNVRLWLKPIADLFHQSPLDAWLRTGQLANSYYPREHASDVLRYLLLWRYGGVYLDTDVMLRRLLPEQRNFASAESESTVESAVLALGLAPVGRRLAIYLLEEISERFRGDVWAQNGPAAVTRALIRLCNTEQVSMMTSKQCGGFSVLPQKEFFAVPYTEWKFFFDEPQVDYVMKQANNSYGVHFWNKLSHVQEVTLDSRQPYALLARQHCPRVVAVAGGFL